MRRGAFSIRTDPLVAFGTATTMRCGVRLRPARSRTSTPLTLTRCASPSTRAIPAAPARGLEEKDAISRVGHLRRDARGPDGPAPPHHPVPARQLPRAATAIRGRHEGVVVRLHERRRLVRRVDLVPNSPWRAI